MTFTQCFHEKTFIKCKLFIKQKMNISLIFVCYSCKNEEVEEEGGGGTLGETIIRSKSNA